MKIKETAEKLGITTRAIRFYEEKGLIHPHKEEGNRYRVFTDSDIVRLRNITSFREIGMPLTMIKDVMDEWEQERFDLLFRYLNQQRAEMIDEWTQLRDVIQTTERMMGSLKKEGSPRMDEIHEWADRLKALKELRRNWQDRWDFNGQASRYDEQVYRSVGDFNVHQDYDKGLDLAFKWIRPVQGEVGLDIGIGTGNLAGRFVNAGVTMCGVDQSEEMLKIGEKKFPNIPTKLGHFLALPYEDRRFDFVVTSYALHHLDDDQKELAIMEMERVLISIGRLCIVDLMFENAEDRSQYLRQWEEQGRDDVVRSIEDEYFADCSRMLTFLKKRGFRTKHQKINRILHILYAEKNF